MQTLSPPAAPPAGGCLYLWKTEVAVVVEEEEQEQETQVKFKELLCRRMKGKKGKMKEGTPCVDSVDVPTPTAPATAPATATATATAAAALSIVTTFVL